MTTVENAIPYEVPLSPVPQKFSIALSGITYRLRVWWNAAPMGGWQLDINDANDNPLAHGIPLVTGSNLLDQLEYLGIGGWLVVETDYDLEAVPNFNNLGTTSHLYFLTGSGTQ